MLADLFALFVVLFLEGAVYLPDQVNGVVFHPFLDIDLFLYLLSLPLLVPYFPFLAMLFDLFLLTHVIL